MELSPQSDTGSRLHEVLINWTTKLAPEPPALDKLKRAFVGFSAEIDNEDRFISLLYGQSVLDESPLILSQRVPTAFLRVQYGIEIALNNKCFKEIIVALERSKNEKVLIQILNWAENTFGNVQKNHPVDVAPQRVQRSRRFSEIMAGKTLTPRHREISWKGELKKYSVLELCNSKIIVGWDNGQIKIYSSDDLQCQKEFNYPLTSVTCLQCTCMEIIAGYNNGSILVWNIGNGILFHQLYVQDENENSNHDFSTCIRWKEPKLVVGTRKGKVQIWQYASCSFTLLTSWDSRIGDGIRYVNFNENCVILQRCRLESKVVFGRSFSGQKIRTISSLSEMRCVALDGHHVITGGNGQALQICDMNTGMCVDDVYGHEDVICAVAAHGGVLVSGDKSGRIIIWNMKEILELRQAELVSFTDPTLKLVHDGFDIKVGPSLIVTCSWNSEPQKLVVTDFPNTGIRK